MVGSFSSLVRFVVVFVCGEITKKATLGSQLSRIESRVRLHSFAPR